MLEDASHVVFGFSAKPDCEASAQQAIVVAGIGNDAATRGENKAAMALKDAIESDALQAVVTGLAVEIENDGQREARVALDLAIKFDERTLQTLREEGAKSGLAGAAQSGESDAGAAQASGSTAEFLEKEFVGVVEVGGWKPFEKGGGLLEGGRSGKILRSECFDGNVERAGQFAQASDGDVAAAHLDFGEKAGRQLTLLGELILCETAADAGRAKPLSELPEIFGHGFVGG